MFQSRSQPFFIHGFMFKDYSDDEKGNPQPPLHGLIFLINSKGSFLRTRIIIHRTAFVTPVVESWLGREISQWSTI